MEGKSFIPYSYEYQDVETVASKASSFREVMDQRRTIRAFSDEPIPGKIIEDIIMTASTAPSGAHKQPWTFCAISDHDLKKEIRIAAEKEEYINYHGRMPEEWLEDLKPFDTDWNKGFITTAPWIIILFKKSYQLTERGKSKNYYVNESVGIAAGMLITAIHMAGLATLTHTPSPMNFLGKILNRPENEKAFLLLPVGRPVEDVKVPNISRKKPDEVIIWK
ncbi:MAG: nitroreductase family protein [Saprospiraceae bacterium]|nr:nitroreductase family protein [Saprospiraceae bacterium]